MISGLTYIAIFFVIVPMILSALTYKALKFSPALFWLLLIGFLIDLGNLFDKELHISKLVLWDGYSIFECAMLIWMVRYRKNGLQLKHFVVALLLIAIPLWAICKFGYADTFLADDLGVGALSLFILLYQVYIVFYSAREILYMSEQDGNLARLPGFWIFTGIFFYAIGTFFIMSFLNKPILLDMFFINNMVNITTHALFLTGLLLQLWLKRSATL